MMEGIFYLIAVLAMAVVFVFVVLHDRSVGKKLKNMQSDMETLNDNMIEIYKAATKEPEATNNGHKEPEPVAAVPVATDKMAKARAARKRAKRES